MQKDMPVAPKLEVVDGKVMTTSLVVAEYFGKRHDNVMRAVIGLECSESFAALNFEECKYKDPNNREREMFRMTKDGFTFLVMGFTGKLAAEFKEAYINEFNRMQEQLANQGLPFWNQAITAPDVKFFEKMLLEAGKGNNFCRTVLQEHYKIKETYPNTLFICETCGHEVDITTAVVKKAKA